MISFGQNLYLWRLFRGLSQEALAKKARIPRPNLSAFETSKREPTLPTMRALAIALEVYPGTLASGIPPEYFKEPISRGSLEDIVKESLGKRVPHISLSQRAIGSMLSKIISNRVCAQKKIYKNTLKNRSEYITNWLILKASLKPEILNNLLSRLDKQIESLS